MEDGATWRSVAVHEEEWMVVGHGKSYGGEQEQDDVHLRSNNVGGEGYLKYLSYPGFFL